MNLILLQAGYPPAIIRNEDRRRYINALEQVQLGGSLEAYLTLIYEAVERSLDIYLEAMEQSLTPADRPVETPDLLKIGQLAKRSGEPVHTIRYWTQVGLLTVAGYSPGGYQLYTPAMIERVKEIRRLQKQNRLTLQEIKTYFSNESE
jgi:hypothetical protein